MNEHLTGNQHGRIRYDDALCLITEQKMSVRQVSAELGVSMDSLRHWLKKSGLNPKIENRGNLMSKKMRSLSS